VRTPNSESAPFTSSAKRARLRMLGRALKASFAAAPTREVRNASCRCCGYSGWTCIRRWVYRGIQQRDE
jgi:hypothetical protein